MQLIPPNNEGNLANNKLLLSEINSKNKPKFDRQGLTISKGILNNLDKILFAIGSMYLILVFNWWVNKNKITLPWQSQFVAETRRETNLKIANSDERFINYMNESLAAIDRKIEAKKQQTKARLQSHVQQTKVKIIEKIERVYIPVKTPLGQHSATRLIVPKPPPLKGTTSFFSKQTATRKTVATTFESDVSHVLVGLFESGNSSVALFSINGITQRIKIGQEIGRSGWTLIGAANREAKISRNGRVRRISTGEKI